MDSKADGITDKVEMDTVCELLDKTLLQQLHLMEEKMKHELILESNIKHGSIHLAKSRYIMGHTSVSTTRLPVETSPEFSASTVCEETEIDNNKQLQVVENKDSNTINPLHWFGILVPQNLHEAKKVFRRTIDVVVDCVNLQIRLLENMKNMEALKQYKKLLTNDLI
ncbi:PREDICTED: coiled-coil domain-containing protein 115 [Papilio xuthus]|uniref:Vacuolar ATPase assembly protein VMA22 n=2 Tax=Papilio xuthus TaxID=66420 RepID=A0AAJ6Z5U5_PAPXU|nr:PREDICTED: coiled-coil domain-containing protein 115 [Papilio xuthus]